MRPIHLSVSGLHSFRERQDIDFQSLCEGGVFGIFGPTGSGKSSLLDALTLALYGKIERAANTIQGIMNHAEDQLHVSFTFELGTQQTGKRYKVERTYKKGKNDSIRTSTCRLIEIIHDETAVLADKERDVTSQVESILGLTITDFTRAVVLPQGKFAEFLSLKGTERRQMLQRLFHLEKYGDHLNHRLKSRVEETSVYLKEILAEQQGLGNASKEMVEELQHQLEESIDAVKRKNLNLDKKEVQFEHYRQIWSWQEELDEVKRKLAQLEEKAPVIAGLEKNLKLAEEADSLFPFVEELESILTEQQTWKGKKEELSRSSEQSKHLVEETQNLVHEIQNERTEKEPVLYEHLQQLKQAKQMEIEFEKEKRSLSDEKLKLTKAEEELEAVETKLIKLKRKKQQAIEKQAEIKASIKKKTIPIEHRNRLRDALALKQEISRANETKDELIREQSKIASTEKKLNDEISMLKKQKKNVKQNIGYLLQHIETLYNRVCEHDRVIERAELSIDLYLKDTVQKLKTIELHALSAQIAEELRAGEACPVCGSKEHPAPVSKIAEGDEDYKEMVVELELIYKSLKEEEKAVNFSKKDLEHLFEAIQEYVKKGEFSEDEIAATTFDPIENSLQSIKDLNDYLKLLKTETKGFKQDVIELKEKRSKFISLFAEYDKKLLEKTTNLNSCKRDSAKLEEKLKEFNQISVEQEKRWNESFKSYQFDHLERLQKEMDEIEREVTDLNERYDRSVTYLVDVDGTITSAVEDYQSLKLHVAELSSKVSNMEKRCEQLHEKIEGICGNDKAEKLYQNVQLQLDELKQKEQTALQQAEMESKKLQKIEQEFEVAKSTLQNIEVRLSRAQDKWNQLAEETSFDSKEQVKEALVPTQKQKVWEEEIKRYHKQKQNHQHDQKRLFNLLNNKEVSIEEWERVQEELRQAKQEKEEAVSEKAKIETALSDLQNRAEKFAMLEEKRLRNVELSERLGKLQAVFRGNSFVEFIAEEQLNQVAEDASQRLGELTRQRYALEVDSSGGFVIRDDANGGVRRPVTSLSGGETFLTSLALALSLSAQIQLQGEYPLEFFFLDEGFGTLDQSLLDTVISALERLQMQRVSVGVISHVPELRARLPRKLIVTPAAPSGKGSSVAIETL
ncbi:AAA family ATPase [Pseudalkalibacillus salsuginis]|uniref:AAA family ATPase n=1 Tax=Pseudalkalibacillus salsuginis TaxID=2910972 RepID=UPI001F1BCAF1|nr:AAA family ATPase [Pseudalkalibacillus salsuginis]MCF6409273.1 AAA family ATPase [Pseudalkalibacillus salsuginis]